MLVLQSKRAWPALFMKTGYLMHSYKLPETRCKKTQALMGDASRVGIEKGGKYEPLLNNSCIFSRRETRRPH